MSSTSNNNQTTKISKLLRHQSFDAILLGISTQIHLWWTEKCCGNKVISTPLHVLIQRPLHNMEGNICSNIYGGNSPCNTPDTPQTMFGVRINSLNNNITSTRKGTRFLRAFYPNLPGVNKKNLVSMFCPCPKKFSWPQTSFEKRLGCCESYLHHICCCICFLSY